MARRLTFEEAIELGRSLRLYDIYGDPILTRAEWERLGWWTRFRDRLLAWDPPKNDRSGYNPPPLDAPD